MLYYAQKFRGYKRKPFRARFLYVIVTDPRQDARRSGVRRRGTRETARATRTLSLPREIPFGHEIPASGGR